MKIIVNGEEMIFEEMVTLLNLLEKLNLKESVMAAALNMEIIKQDQWPTQQLSDGDRLELLDFVGGG